MLAGNRGFGVALEVVVMAQVRMWLVDIDKWIAQTLGRINDRQSLVIGWVQELRRGKHQD